MSLQRQLSGLSQERIMNHSDEVMIMDKVNKAYWSLSSSQVLDELNSTPNGLTSKDAEERLKSDGPNVLVPKKKTMGFLVFLKQFKNPIIIILLIATLISAFTGEWVDATIILLIVLISSLLSYFQEHSASRALEELRAKVQVKTRVQRDGRELEIPASQLVSGDIVLISTGSLIPADGLILDSRDLHVNESVLTGEALPAQKKAGIVPVDSQLRDRSNCVFMGTSVNNGSARVVIVKVGQATAFGEIAGSLTLRPPETEFELGIRHFGFLLTQIMLILTLAVFAINVISDKPAIDSLLFSVALAVGITPQLLPAIISLTLSKGSRIMAKEGVIVRRLNAIENFGSMDTLCTDKTGTLTEGRIRIDGAKDVKGEEAREVYRLAYLNAYFQGGMHNTLDQAIIQGETPDLRGIVKKGEIPFDFQRKRLSVILEEAGTIRLISKGAFNKILEISDEVFIEGKAQPMDKEILASLKEQYANWSNQGIRVLGVAEKVIPLQDKYALLDESRLTFRGFLLLYDHPKADVAETIRDLAGNGIRLCIITGDNRLIAMHTAESVGIKVRDAVTGSDLKAMTDEVLWQRIETIDLFSEVDPNQKERIILALKKKGHVVGYLGDGINDVPALHAADVSISVDNAADIAKESADLVLLDNELAVLSRGVILGRTTFLNTLKYIQVTTSANFGNMFSMAGFSLFIPFLPLLPKQILLLNFLTDFPAITLAGDRVDEELLKKPQHWDIRFIRNYMLVFGLISSLFDFITLAVLLLVFRVPEAEFQTSWFIISVLTELMVLLVMRTRKAFFRSRPSAAMLWACLAVAVVAVTLPYLPFNQYLGFQPVQPMILFILLLIILIYIATTEGVKVIFYARVDRRRGS